MKYNKWTNSERRALLEEMKSRGRVSFGRRGRPAKGRKGYKLSATLQRLLQRHTAACIRAYGSWLKRTGGEE